MWPTTTTQTTTQTTTTFLGCDSDEINYLISYQIYVTPPSQQIQTLGRLETPSSHTEMWFSLLFFHILVIHDRSASEKIIFQSRLNQNTKISFASEESGGVCSAQTPWNIFYSRYTTFFLINKSESHYRSDRNQFLCK